MGHNRECAVLLLALIMAISAGASIVVSIPGTAEAADAGDPSILTIDSVGDVGERSSIAIDSMGYVHICYYDYTNGDLIWVTNASGSWTKWIIDSEGDVGYNPSIAIDSQDNVHISYYDYTNGDLDYATNAGGSWNLWVIDSDGDVGADSAIAIDSQDNVHISYWDYTNETLRYAENTEGIWNIAIIDSEVAVGYHSAIAIDSQDNVHISYYDATNGNLRYANNTAGTWQKYIMDPDGDTGYDSSIAIDSQDNVHISYCDATNGDLLYATNSAGDWILWIIEDTVEVGDHSSIAIDSLDQFHITYYSYEEGVLCYFTNSGGEPSYWVIDSEGDVGMDSAIAIDKSDGVHISYYDYTNGDLKYAAFSSVGVPSLGPPIGLTATPGAGQVQLDWTAPANDGGSPVDHYVIYQNGTAVTTVTETTVVIDGLTNGVSYDFAVAANNSMGEGPASGTVSATPSAMPAPQVTVPSAPEQLSATPGSGQVLLSWSEPASAGGASITGYVLYWSLNPHADFKSIPVQGTSFLHTGLQGGETYYYYVTAQNQVGEGEPSDQINVTMVDEAAVPSEPTNLTASVDGDEVKLTWDAPSDDGGSPVIEYTVYRGNDSSNMTQVAIVTDTTFVDTNVSEGVDNYYQVTAKNANGLGQASSKVSASVGGSTGTSIPLEYMAVAGVGGAAVVGAAALLLRNKRRAQ